ncbi:MAG: hypothetical protein J5892_02585 [Bacilli bacterium]|nr:hypothetical protein [Bacilli bacterium]
MYLLDASTFCADTANVWQVIGWVLTVFKIVIPLLLIIFGMIDIGKAVTSSKEDEIKKATGALMRRAIAAVVVFFIPTLVGVIMSLVKNAPDYKPCRKCITNPGGTYCKDAANLIWNDDDDTSTVSSN